MSDTIIMYMIGLLQFSAYMEQSTTYGRLGKGALCTYALVGNRATKNKTMLDYKKQRIALKYVDVSILEDLFSIFAAEFQQI